MNRPAAAPEESVAPLRINKSTSFATSGTPPPRIPSAASQAGTQPVFSAPTSKPPSGPLPYPDQRSGSTNPPYPTSYAPPSSTTPDTSSGGRRPSASQGVGSSRPKFNANDPNRPTAAGYASNMSHGSGQSAGGSVGERRGNVPSSLSPTSAGVPAGPDSSKDGLFQRAPPSQSSGQAGASDQRRPSEAANDNPFPDYHQQYWPPPSTGGGTAASNPGGLNIPNPAGSGMNRMDSSASVMTTRAQRGSPPPPETPIIPPTGGGIEARYAAAGFGTPSTTAGANSAAGQRAAQYPGMPRPSAGSTPLPGQSQTGAQPPRRPWTPTEAPGSQPHGPPAVYQGMNEVPTSTPPPNISSPPSVSSGISQTRPGAQALEHDFSRMNVGDEPPPAYHTVTNGAPTAQGYPNEKGRGAAGPSAGFAAANIAQPTPSAPSGFASTSASSMPPAAGAAQNQGHPAFANDPRAQSGASPSPAHSQASTAVASTYAAQNNGSPAPPGAGPASPPPLPEGWIAHLDGKSGQYYYIHLPTQSTQWEFPKGPTPLNMDAPMSPTGTIASPVQSKFPLAQGLASPGFPVPQTATFRPDAYMSMSSIATPTAAGFTGPPPTAGVETYKVAPTNGVYFGPYLRYTNMDIERGIWLGSILLVTDAPSPPTIHMHQSVDLSPNPRQLKPNPIYSHQRWMFYRYDVDLKMDDESSKWTYAVTSHLGCTRYEFVIAGRYETSWRFIAHSGNDFALNVNANERNRLGGVGYMWKDILQKHIECNGFHVQLGLGDQIYADRMWKELPVLRQWTAISGKDVRKNAAWTPQHEDEITHAYFHYYTSHFDQPHIREAFAQIPNVLALDDHDMYVATFSSQDVLLANHVQF